MRIRVSVWLVALISLLVPAIDATSTTSAVSSNVGASSLSLFQKSWQTYKAVVSADLMEHASMTKKISEVIHEWIEDRSSKGYLKSDISIADLGCGDLALLGPVYKSLSLELLCGVDMSLAALELAQIAYQHSPDIGSENSSSLWINADLLSWARTVSAVQGVDGSSDSAGATDGLGLQKFDIIVCAFSVHHLNDEDKIKFLEAIVNNRLKEGGMILMADIFRIKDEDRDEYLQRFSSHIDVTWNTISATEKVSIIKHVTENDFPASLQEFQMSMVPKCGLTGELVWSDTGDFEKLVVLKRI